MIKNIIIFITLISIFSGCGKTRHEIMLEKQKQVQIEDIKLWQKNGYTKQDALNWSNNNFTYKEAKTWLDVNIKNPKVASAYKKANMLPNTIKLWRNNGFKNIDDISPWFNLRYTATDAKKWQDLGFSPKTAKDIDYTQLINELNKQNISLKDYKLWLKFGLIQPDDITYFKSKGHTTKTIKDKNAKDILNKMDLKIFFEFMSIDKERLKNHYIAHWKFNTNFKRFRDIIHRYYSIK